MKILDWTDYQDQISELNQIDLVTKSCEESKIIGEENNRNLNGFRLNRLKSYVMRILNESLGDGSGTLNLKSI